MLALGFHAGSVADTLLAILVVAASLEAFPGFCLGCHAFRLLRRAGIVPSEVCERRNDLWR